MAQPLFDEHPLHDYFRASGELENPMPGSHPEFYTEFSASPQRQETTVGPFISRILSHIRILSDMIPATTFSQPSIAFAERFKYDVISSSLLSNSLAATPQPGRRTFVSEFSGSSEASSSEHSRTSSTSDEQTEPMFGRNQHILGFEPGDARVVMGVLSSAVLAFAAGYELLTMLLLALALYAACAVTPVVEDTNVAPLTLDAVNELISAGNVWDSAVNEAMSIIEKDERSPSVFYSSHSPQSPLLNLRVALQTSLNTTQSQCDNVRQLLAALTSPPQLAQLSEMYAPASPIKPSFTLLDHPRPLSDPTTIWRRRNNSLPSSPNKRATWNGTQVSPLSGMKALRRKEKRRSELNALFLVPEGQPASAPPSPLAQRVLQGVKEEEPSDSESELAYVKEQDVFGVEALNLRRKRRRSGIETFGIPPPSYSSQPLGHGSCSSQSSFSSPSRFTLLQSNRHPFSLSSLNLSLHGALAAKRYACAHLLALRFEEDADDECYWEDVRSIMALLTSTFSDASTTLMAALDETEKKRMKDERPSTESLAGSSREGSISPDAGTKSATAILGRPMRSMAEMTSFAPLPSHLTRFASHIDAISSALNDAREHLEQCVAAIREDRFSNGGTTLTPDPPDGSNLDPFGANVDEDEDPNVVLRAYDRLRKELGFAFRECERGRERLLEVIAASKPEIPPPEDDNSSPNMPTLTHDTSSEDSIAVDGNVDKEDQFMTDVDPSPQHLDDATEHLLITASSKHLPLPGIEQVFEVDTEGANFTRERPKLSREERIKLAKERRASGQGLGISMYPQTQPAREKWGPGGEVVQELKDVIWKVSEKRRKLSERLSLETSDGPESRPDPIHTEVPPVLDQTTGNEEYLS